MSNALAISGVTAVLQYFLNHVYTNSPLAVLGTVKISAVAPDLVPVAASSGSNNPLQVNVFMHQVTLNAAWRNVGLASLAPDGSRPLKNPTPPLDLHYLLTAYAAEDTEAEALLGYAVTMLHENPVLPRAQIRTALQNLSAAFPDNPLKGLLQFSGLADQIEMIKISPATLGREELAWLWTALKADYRPTFPFQVSVVLMRNPNPTVFSLPVLVRNLAVQPGPPAELLAVDPPNDQAAAVPGDTITVTGVSLSGASKVSLVNPKTNVTYAPFKPGTLKDTYFSFTVPEDPANLPVGICEISLLFEDTSGNIIQHTNTVTTAIAAKTLATPKPSASVSGSETLITLSCDPQVLSTQSVFLVVGPNAIAAQPFTGSTAALSFQLPSALGPGTYAARLQVDGVPTPAAASWTFTPPNTLVQ